VKRNSAQDAVITGQPVRILLHRAALLISRPGEQFLMLLRGLLKAPITVVLHDHSISVSGSSNVQIGNWNQQSVTSQISGLISEIDKIDAPEEQKKDAKGLLETITANPLIVAVLGPLLGKVLG
jgi:hypothetical protein